MNHSSIREQLPQLVAHFVPSNCHRIKWHVYDETPQESALGFRIDPKPFKGKVVVITDTAIIIQTARTEFAVVDRQLANRQVEVGEKVEVTPYARRRFDGMRADTPTEETHRTSDGGTYTMRVSKLGDTTIALPVSAPRCPELAALIEKIEKLPAPDGLRRIAHLLVDASAHDFSCVDPEPEDIIRTPPAIGFNVSTSKFAGRVTVSYERGSYNYTVRLDRDGHRIETVPDVGAHCLGETLESLIDDGLWRQIRIETVSAKGTVRHH